MLQIEFNLLALYKDKIKALLAIPHLKSIQILLKILSLLAQGKSEFNVRPTSTKGA